ncbi:MAG: hypothetical protein IJX77_08725 [Ruminococcus sp.]|nr:hypothetical protein [Ruminococcus sp.]MBQ8297851.1 hypothetical protein [Ruminococcus sp.]
MTDQMRNLIILLCGIAVVLILAILLFRGKSPVMKFLSIFLEERDDDDMPKNGKGNQKGLPMNGQYSGNVNTSQRMYPNEDYQKKTSEPLVEMATLIRKSDDRLRVIESTGQTKLIDEYYELVFVTRRGKTLKIECSRAAYERMPFNQQGSLTYRRNTLVKFKYYEDTILN